jgi:predicted small secreted protein
MDQGTGQQIQFFSDTKKNGVASGNFRQQITAARILDKVPKKEIKYKSGVVFVCPQMKTRRIGGDMGKMNKLRLILLLAAFLLAACGKNGQGNDQKNGQKSARSGFYIEEPVRGAARESPAAKIPQINYFFDRTSSMEGFVFKKDTEYIRILPRLFRVAETPTLWPSSEKTASFYKFTTGNIYKVSREHILDKVQEKSFYNTVGEYREVISENNVQVFKNVANYIARNIASEFSPDKLFIVVSDLYEQKMEDNCFSILFQNAFEHGMSGAIIAIQSGFNGIIENISGKLTDPGIPVNGISTFFIFIIGPRDSLLQYCEAFFADTVFLSLKSEKVLFLLGDGSGLSELPWTPAISKANSEKRFEKIAGNNNINLKENIPRLFTVKGNTVDPAKTVSFRLIGNVRSQYVGGLPVKNIDFNSFDFEPKFITVEYFSGDSNTEGKLSEFKPINDKEKSNFTIEAINGDKVKNMDSARYPLAVVINTNNDSLNKGCYLINYEIFQKAKIPQWVTERNAGTEDELRESVKQDTAVKILRLESIYKYIAEAYNKQPEWGRVYFDSLYLEKQR